VQAGKAADAAKLLTASESDLADPVAEAQARLGIGMLMAQYAPAAVAEQCQAALRLPGVPPVLRVQLLSLLACGLDISGEPDAAAGPVADAIAEATASGDLTAEKARFALTGLALTGLVAIPSAAAAASTSSHSHAAVKPTIVLEHGAWADGSSWSGVITRLQKDGYTVDVPPNPLRGLDSDSAYLASYLATVPGPIVLVGHSYGGFVITNAATGDKNVKALVYVDAYIPAQGDTVNSLTSQFPGSQIAPSALNFVPSPGGVTDVYVKPPLFRSILANNLPASQAAELAATQRPIAANTLTEVSGPPAWSSIPSWAVIGTADHAIPPAAQEFMARRAHATVTEIDASHLSLISHPGEVTDGSNRPRATRPRTPGQRIPGTPDDGLYAKSIRRSSHGKRILFSAELASAVEDALTVMHGIAASGVQLAGGSIGSVRRAAAPGDPAADGSGVTCPRRSA
jgi:pimeloyl-ACP methyl ester carboxylesterase